MDFFSWLNKNKPKKVKKIEKQEVKSLVIQGERKLSIEEIANKISTLSFIRFRKDTNKLTIELIESEDYQKNPYLFTRLTFTADSINLTYSVTPETNEHYRLVETCKLLLNILILTKAYSISLDSLFNFLYTSLESSSELITLDILELQNKVELLHQENKKLLKKHADTLAINEKMDRLILETGKREQLLLEKLAIFEQISDEFLTEEVYHWISLRNGQMNITEFSKLYNIPEVRVEKSIDFLLKNGYILRAGEHNGH